MKSAPYFARKPPSESTFTGPARFTSPCAMTIFTPGCSGSVVLNTDVHSRALSMRYFPVTRSTARISPPSGSASASSVPSAMEPAAVLSAESVIGIGQNRPAAVRYRSHTPSQSARVMKPSSGVNPPMPSMIRSPRSREETVSLGSKRARLRSATSCSPSSSRGRNFPPPWGFTSLTPMNFRYCIGGSLPCADSKGMARATASN